MLYQQLLTVDVARADLLSDQSKPKVAKFISLYMIEDDVKKNFSENFL